MPTPYTQQTKPGTSNVKSGPQGPSSGNVRNAAIAGLGAIGKSASQRSKEIDSAVDTPMSRGGEANATAEHAIKPGDSGEGLAGKVKRGRRIA